MSDDERKGAGAAAGTDCLAYIDFKKALEKKGKDVKKFQRLPDEAIYAVMKELGVSPLEQGDVLEDFRKHFPLPTNTVVFGGVPSIILPINRARAENSTVEERMSKQVNDCSPEELVKEVQKDVWVFNRWPKQALETFKDADAVSLAPVIGVTRGWILRYQQLCEEEIIRLSQSYDQKRFWDALKSMKDTEMKDADIIRLVGKELSTPSTSSKESSPTKSEHGNDKGY